ncbi:MAG: hypothetical protein IJ057_10960 [Bacteroidales bacterium]|nr:hypothetical protein [Bacteroidales bacterium]
MKVYKWLRGLLKASSLTTLMFIMQACYGSPYGPDSFVEPDDMELTEESDTLVSLVPSDLQSDDVEYEDLQSEE